MAELSTDRRRQLPAKEFAQPGARKYPVPDKSHATAAKARAEQQYRAGRITRAQRDRIFARADRVLYAGSRGGDHIYLRAPAAPRRRGERSDDSPQWKIKPNVPRRQKRGHQPQA